MAKSQGLKRWFAKAKTVPVKVNEKTMQFTVTQAVRLGELEERHRAEQHTAPGDRAIPTAWPLKDAALRLFMSEQSVIADAAECKFPLYASIAGVRGRWTCETPDGEVRRSAPQVEDSGFLALLPRDIEAIARHGQADVSTLELRLPPQRSAADLSPRTLAALDSWGAGHKRFLPETPMRVERSRLFLMPPLHGVTG